MSARTTATRWHVPNSRPAIKRLRYSWSTNRLMRFFLKPIALSKANSLLRKSMRKTAGLYRDIVSLGPHSKEAPAAQMKIGLAWEKHAQGFHFYLDYLSFLV